MYNVIIMFGPKLTCHHKCTSPLVLLEAVPKLGVVDPLDGGELEIETEPCSQPENTC